MLHSQWLSAFLGWLDRYRFVLFAVLVAILLAGLNAHWQVEPDSALYLTLARNIAMGRGYIYHGETHHLVYPGLPYALSVFFRWFPGREILASNGLILACCFIYLGLVYRLFSLSVNRSTALVITLLAGLAHESFRYSYEIMPEIPFLAAVMAVLAGFEALYHCEKCPAWFDWGLFIAGILAAAYLKPLMIPLIGVCLFAMPWRTERSQLLRRCGIGAGILLGALLLFFLCDPRHPFSAVSKASYEQLAYREVSRLPTRWHTVLARNLSDLLGKSITRVVIGVPLGVRVLDVMLSLAILAGAMALVRFRLLWGLWIFVVIAKLTFLYSHDRYLLPILPLIMFAWWNIIVRVCSMLPELPAKVLFAMLLASTTIPSLVKAISTIVDQHRHPFLETYHGGRAVALEQIGHQLTKLAGPGDVILSPSRTSTVLTFYSDRNVYEPILEPRLPGRILVVCPVDVTDPEFAGWLADLHLKPPGDALFICPRAVRQGGSFAVYEARR